MSGSGCRAGKPVCIQNIFAGQPAGGGACPTGGHTIRLGYDLPLCVQQMHKNAVAGREFGLGTPEQIKLALAAGLLASFA